jgi:hypothetical protein
MRQGINESLRELRKDVNVFELPEEVQDMDLGYELDQFQYDDEDVMVDKMLDCIRQARDAYEFDPNLDAFAVVTESFSLRVFSENKALLAPVRINAKLERDMRKLRFPLQWQTPSDAKSVVTDARLKHWHVWHQGSDHMHDAQRHGILFMRRWGGQARLRTAVGSGSAIRGL